MGYLQALPLFYTKIGFIYFLLCLTMEVILMLGMLNIWLLLKEKINVCRNESILFDLATSIILVPLIIFPIHFTVSFFGFYRQFLIVIQIILLFSGLHCIFVAQLPKKIYRDSYRCSFLTLLCVITVILFLYWPFLMPYAEKFNGHHHALINMVQRLWQDGNFPLLPPEFVSYDNMLYVFPANFPFFFSIFSFPYIPAIGEHALFLVPGMLSFITWQLLKVLCKKIDVDSRVGDLAFLTIAFSYLNASDFSMIHYDSFSPLVCIYFLVIYVDIFYKKDLSKFAFAALLLSFTFLIRKQLFLVISTIFILALLLEILQRCYKRQRFLIFQKANLGAALLFLIPMIFWCTVVYNIYGSPFYPHDVSITQKIFKLRIPIVKQYIIDETRNQKNTATTVLPSSKFLEFIRIIKTHKNYSNVNYFVENFFPIHLVKGLSVFIKNIFCGLSNSLILMAGFFGFVLLALFKKISESKFLGTVAVIMASYILVGVSFFLVYPKYPHYLGYVICIFSAVFYWRVFGSLYAGALINIIAALIFVNGIIFWGYNSWGHSYQDKTFENFRFLWPYYRTPLDRLARQANMDKNEIVKEIQQLIAIKQVITNKGGHILYMEHEPGLLVPSILNYDNFANVYFLDNKRSELIYQAANVRELSDAFKKLEIKYVYRNRRSHSNVLLIYILDKMDGDKIIYTVDEIIKKGYELSPIVLQDELILKEDGAFFVLGVA